MRFADSSSIQLLLIYRYSFIFSSIWNVVRQSNTHYLPVSLALHTVMDEFLNDLLQNIL